MCNGEEQGKIKRRGRSKARVWMEVVVQDADSQASSASVHSCNPIAAQLQRFGGALLVGLNHEGE